MSFAPYPVINGAATHHPPPPRRSVEPPANLQAPPRMQVERNGAMPMPVTTSQRQFGGTPGEMGGFAPTGGARSPPKNKNTQHVPCKFFLHNQCQAGRMCPFSHDVESSTRPAPCKFFAKGGCKFGRKCALLHITPDGTVVNRGPQFTPAPQLQPLPPPLMQQPPPGLLSMQAQGLDRSPNGDMSPEFEGQLFQPPQIDIAYANTSTSPTYGSPIQDSRFGNSPSAKGLSVLDAPLPNSFDSNGISMAARNGPFAASVPSRFGVESPSSSLPRKSHFGNTALRDLHNSAFGDMGMDGVLAGSSPPTGPHEPLTFEKRPLHSEWLLAAGHPMISASLGTKLPTQSFEYSDDESDNDRKEDLLPSSLHDLISDRKTINGNRPRAEEESSPASFLAASRRSLSGHGTPQDSKVGSPHSSSPSRYTGLFTRSQSGRADGEGLVGSPLRNSGFGFTSSSRTASGDLSPTVGSPPRQASMSVLTQELQRTRLDAARSQAAASVGMSRTFSNGSTGRSSLERAVSGNGVRERIDEEQDLFDMDEVGDPNKSAPRTIPGAGGKSNGAWGIKPFGSSPGNGEQVSGFGAIGGHRTAK